MTQEKAKPSRVRTVVLFAALAIPGLGFWGRLIQDRVAQGRSGGGKDSALLLAFLFWTPLALFCGLLICFVPGPCWVRVATAVLDLSVPAYLAWCFLTGLRFI
jgi:hypothetical protein